MPIPPHNISYAMSTDEETSFVLLFCLYFFCHKQITISKTTFLYKVKLKKKTCTKPHSHSYMSTRKKNEEACQNMVQKCWYLHPKYTHTPASNNVIKNPAITAQPHRWLSPNFRLVNRMSESVDITDSAVRLRDDEWRLHFRLGCMLVT